MGEAYNHIKVFGPAMSKKEELEQKTYWAKKGQSRRHIGPISLRYAGEKAT